MRKFRLTITVFNSEPDYPLQFSVDAVEDLLGELRRIDPQLEQSGNLPPSVSIKTEDGITANAQLAFTSA